MRQVAQSYKERLLTNSAIVITLRRMANFYCCDVAKTRPGCSDKSQLFAQVPLFEMVLQ